MFTRFQTIKIPRGLHLVAIVAGLLVCTACQNQVQQTVTTEPRVRAAIESGSAGTIKAAVFVEGPDGNALSGAVVTIKDERNITKHLVYNATTCSYNGIFEETGATTEYTVEAASILSAAVIRLTVPYTALTTKPDIMVFQDSLGNSVLNGKALSPGLPLQIGWKDCGENVVYQVQIRTNLTTVYAVSTNACTVTIDAGAIKSGVYILEISAQKINGDILYRTLPYYSASFAAAPLMSFNVN